jgi:hypothetical protein
MTWLKDHLFPRKSSGKVLIVLNGNSSHVSDFDILDFANENDVVVLFLPSHSTHNLQPLDKSFFKSLKHYFHETCQTLMLRKITRLQFGQLLSKAWASPLPPAMACRGLGTRVSQMKTVKKFLNLIY